MRCAVGCQNESVKPSGHRQANQAPAATIAALLQTISQRLPLGRDAAITLSPQKAHSQIASREYAQCHHQWNGDTALSLDTRIRQARARGTRIRPPREAHRAVHCERAPLQCVRAERLTAQVGHTTAIKCNSIL